MFCSQCLMAVGPRDRVCSACGADLTAPGSVRLTDPRRISAKSKTSSRTAAAAPSATAESEIPGQAATEETPVASAESIASAEAAESLVASVDDPETVDEPESVDAADESVADATDESVADESDESVADESGEPSGGSADQSGEPVDQGGEPEISAETDEPESAPEAEPEIAAADPSAGVVAEIVPAAAPVVAPQVVYRRRDPDELSLWDDYGMAEEPEPKPIEPGIGSRDQVNHLLGASAIPAAKVLSAAAVLGVTALILLVLVGRLLTLDSLVVTSTDQQAAPAPSVTEAPEPEPEPTEEPTEEATTTEPAPAKVTPSMQPGAKECDAGIWAGPQTSCVLANEVGSQIKTDMTGSVTVEAFSASSNRNYRLECVAKDGITCTGLDGVEGLNVWIVATTEG